jgi:hypothetical protein
MSPPEGRRVRDDRQARSPALELGTGGEWVSALPTDFVRERAWPLYWRGLSRLEGDPPPAVMTSRRR